MGSTRPKVNVLIAMVAAAAAAGSRFLMGSQTFAGMGLGGGPAVLSSRNGGRRGGNMQAIRASRKARNQARHRKACR